MNRSSKAAFACLAALSGITLVLTSSPIAQGPTPMPSVWLQSGSPGTTQIGNSNISGTAIAGTFSGSGAGLIGIPWSAIVGAPAAFPPSGAAAGDLSGTYPNPTLATLATSLNKVSGGAMTALASGEIGIGIAIPSTKLHLNGGSIRSDWLHTNDQTPSIYVRNLNSTLATPAAGTHGIWAGVSSDTAEIKRGVSGNAYGASGSKYGVRGEAVGAGNNYAVFGLASGGTNNWAGYFSGDGYFSGSVGIGTSAPSVAVDVVGQILATSSTTVSDSAAIRGEATGGVNSIYGVHGVSNSSNGSGVRGNNSAVTGDSNGVSGSTLSVNGRGVYGVAVPLTGASSGVYGRSNSSVGAGVRGVVASSGPNFGVYGQVFDGTGVFGLTTDLGAGYGVHGETVGNTTSCRGVYGAASTVAGGTTYGVYGEANNNSGRGVYGTTTNTTAGDVPYGVRGNCSTLNSGYAVYAVGDMGASGLKPFRIDHPFDPLGKYLVHYASEGPLPQNVYNGIVVTDANGLARVQLPDYFEEINKDFRYTLTVVNEGDDFVLAKVSKKIRNNAFQIRTSKPNIEVSWEVKGTRNDAYCRVKQPQDVISKVAPELGRYQHPELYGAPAEMGMDYADKLNEKMKRRAAGLIK